MNWKAIDMIQQMLWNEGFIWDLTGDHAILFSRDKKKMSQALRQEIEFHRNDIEDYVKWRRKDFFPDGPGLGSSEP